MSVPSRSVVVIVVVAWRRVASFVHPVFHVGKLLVIVRCGVCGSVTAIIQTFLRRSSTCSTWWTTPMRPVRAWWGTTRDNGQSLVASDKQSTKRRIKQVYVCAHPRTGARNGPMVLDGDSLVPVLEGIETAPDIPGVCARACVRACVLCSSNLLPPPSVLLRGRLF